MLNRRIYNRTSTSFPNYNPPHIHSSINRIKLITAKRQGTINYVTCFLIFVSPRFSFVTAISLPAIENSVNEPTQKPIFSSEIAHSNSILQSDNSNTLYTQLDEETLTHLQYMALLRSQGIEGLCEFDPLKKQLHSKTYSEHYRNVFNEFTALESKVSGKSGLDQSILNRIDERMARPESPSDDLMDVEDGGEATKAQRQKELLSKRKQQVSPYDKSAVEQAFRRPNSHDVLIDKFNIDMTYSKFSCLRPAAWLNDEVINFYMSMLQEYDSQKHEKDPKLYPLTCHYFNSFFYSKLLENGSYNYSNVKRWTKKFDILSKDKIFIPVNLSNTHWTMCIIYMKKKEIHYYDSMSGSGKRYLDAALRWIVDDVKDKKQELVNPSEWKLIDRENIVPQQANGYDCGVFSIMCADYVSDELPFEYGQSEMSMNRVKIGAAIIRGSLNYM
jgi:Ulp1 family protease